MWCDCGLTFISLPGITHLFYVLQGTEESDKKIEVRVLLEKLFGSFTQVSGVIFIWKTLWCLTIIQRKREKDTHLSWGQFPQSSPSNIYWAEVRCFEVLGLGGLKNKKQKHQNLLFSARFLSIIYPIGGGKKKSKHLFWQMEPRDTNLKIIQTLVYLSLATYWQLEFHGLTHLQGWDNPTKQANMLI